MALANDVCASDKCPQYYNEQVEEWKILLDNWLRKEYKKMNLINCNYLQQRITENICSDLENNNIFGASVLIAQNDKIIYKNWYGDNKENSLFRLASMTKPISAVAIGILCDRGLISLDDDIESYIGNFENNNIVETDGNGKIIETIPSTNKIKIRHLLAHSSGIYDKDQEEMPDLQTAVAHYKKNALRIFDAGQKQSYDTSMCAYDILAYIVEKVTGNAFKDFVKENILTPLKMMDTTFLQNREQWSRVVKMHDKVMGESVEKDMGDRVFGNFDNRRCLAGAGLIGSIDDYANFASMLQNYGTFEGERIVSEAYIQQMQQPVTGENLMVKAYQAWGLGVRVLTDKYILPKGCYGWSGAYGTHFWIDPANKIYAIYMKNSMYDGGSEAKTAKAFEVAVAESLT